MDRFKWKLEIATVPTGAKSTQTFDEIADNLMVGTGVIEVLTVLTDRCIKALKVNGIEVKALGLMLMLLG